MPHPNAYVNILVAEDNDVSRGLLVATLNTAGYTIREARDGDEAIDIVDQHPIDCAFVDINMSPKGGFDFMKHLLVEGIALPVVIITADTSSDILMQANELGVRRLLQKPVDPQLLLKITTQILERQGQTNAIAVEEAHSHDKTDEEYMREAIKIGKDNEASGKGRAFGAIVVDTDGRIIGRGANGITSRIDPTAHAEVMAIRQAAEHLGQPDLSNCALYCSHMPTMMGKALIASVAIPRVYYAQDNTKNRDHNNDAPDYKQIKD